MGHLELFAQRTFAEETGRITRGAAGWQDPPEIRLEKVQADGFLVIGLLGSYGATPSARAASA